MSMTARQAFPGIVNPIVERMVGETDEPGQIAETARACALRALPAFAEGLNARLTWPVEIEIAQVEVVRFVEARPPEDGNCAFVVAGAPSSPDALMLSLDPSAVSLIIASMLGSDADIPAPAITRALSPIELEAASALFADFVQAFGGSGSRSFDFHLPLPAPLTSAELKKLVIRDSPAVRITFSLSAPAGQGMFGVVMPQRVLMTYRKDGQKGDARNAGGSQWNARFGEEVLRSSVRLEATLRLEPMTLADVGRLHVGQLLEFPEAAGANTCLSARNTPIFMCEFGRLGQNYTVRIQQEYDAGQDLIEGIIAR